MKFLEEKKLDKSWDAQQKGSYDVNAEPLDDRFRSTKLIFYTRTPSYPGIRLVSFLFLVIFLFIAVLYSA